MNKILKNWDSARIIRLILGVVIAVYAISAREYAFLILGGFFLFQAVLNVSCCGSGGCYTDEGNSKKNVYKDQIKDYKPD